MSKKRTVSMISQSLALLMIVQAIAVFPARVNAETNAETPSVFNSVYSNADTSVFNSVYSNAATPVFNPDYSKLIGRSDLTHTGRIATGTQGMPVANGRFGGPVWQSSGNTLVMQLNHTDTFMFNDASSVSKDHLNSGGGAVGRIHVGFGTGTVFNDATEQHLSLYEGKLSVDGDGVDVNVIANMDSDAIAIQITDNRAAPSAITVDLAMLREANQIWGAHSAVSTLTTEEDNTTIVLEQVIREDSDTGIEVNDFYVNTAVAATVQGRDVTSVANSTVGSRTALRLNLPAQTGTFTVVIGGESTMNEDVDAKANAIANATESPDYDSIYASSQAWWSDFWQKSYVYLPSQSDFEQRRNYYMYLSAISNRGSFPSKYNGGIWIAEEDRRDWGSYYWNWNQDSLYQPLMAANHLDLMDPLFKMRESSFEQYETAARQMWGSDGIFIGETAGILGWETLPDNIAEAMREYYTFKTDTRTQEFTDFTKKRNNYLPAWNWNVFGSGNNQASFVSHTMMATQETAEYYWQVYSYTKDLDWLRERAYPFIKGAAELYRTYDGFRKEEDGKYHFYNTNLHEHIWGGKDVIDDLSMARGVFSVVVEASELLGVDEDLRLLWEDCRDNLADYPLRSAPGALYAVSTNSSLASQLATDEPAWAQGLQPAYFIRDLHGTESPIFKMLEKYDVLNLETRDQGLDNGDWEIALNTYLHSPGYVNQVKNQVIDRNGSSRFHVDAAKLGRADDMEMILNTQYGVFSTYGEFPNLLFNQLDYYSAEGYGTFAAALQEALNQSLSPTPDGDAVIRVFPAWPKAWDAKYKLLAKEGFLVSSSMESGDIQYVEIESQLGEICRIRNPWDSNVVLYRNGIKAETINATENELLAFETDAGENIVLVRTGTTPDTYRTSELTESSYSVANDTNGNIVYTGSWESSDGRQSDDYAKDIHYTDTNGDSAEFTFYGAGIDYITELGPDMGEVEVYIDGILQQTVDCYSEEMLFQQTAYVNVGLNYGRHKIKIVKKSGERMAVDAFGIRRETGINVDTVNDNDLDAVTYANASGATTQAEGAWFYTNNRSGEGAYQNDAHISGNSSSGGIGNYSELRFYGTGVAFLTERNNDMGEIDVYIDDVFQETVTSYKTGGRDSQYTLYSNTQLPLGEHTLKLEKKSGQYMIVDAFKVWGPVSDPEVTYIKINKQPQLSYNEGAALDLSGMEIEAAYSDGSMKTLAYNDAGISVQLASGEAIANEDVLTQTAHDSRTLMISYGGRIAKTQALQVESQTGPINNYSISGRITVSGTGAAIQATVQLKNGDDNLGNPVTANPDGTYTITNVSAGTYSIVVSMPGYEIKAITGITVSEENIEGADAALEALALTVQGVSLNKSTLMLNVGGAAGELTATVVPEEAANKNVTWSSSNTAVATVSDRVITPVRAGTATITVTTEDGGYTAECIVTVQRGGGGNTTQPPVIEPEAPTQYQTTNGVVIGEAAVDSDKTASINFETDVVEAAIKSGKGGTLKLEVKNTEGSERIQVGIPGSIIRTAQENHIDTIQVDMGDAAVTMGSELLKNNIKSDNANILLSLRMVTPSELSGEVWNVVGDQRVYAYFLSVGGEEINSFGTNDITVSLDYTQSPGQSPDKVVLYTIDANGEWRIAVNGRYNSQTGKAEFKPAHPGPFAAVYADISFIDTNDVPWAEDSIEALAAREVIKGIGNDKFAPNNNVTRAEFLQILMSAFDLTGNHANSDFSDVDKEAWYYDAVSAAQSMGIISGRPDGTFGANDTITREDMAVMIYRIVQNMNLGLGGNNSNEIRFADESGIAAYAYDAVNEMKNAGIINGVGDNKFAPREKATRAEAAVIIYRLFKVAI